MFKKILSVMLCAVLLVGSCITLVSADEAKSVVNGARWFPCEEGRENDILWEVQFGEGENRGFLDGSEGDENWLSTTYNEDGSLTLARTGSDGNDVFWPSCRTLYLEEYPELDWKVANTLYFDFETNAQWNLQLSINGMSLKLSKVISDACGVSGVANSNADGVAGTYKGSINLQDAIAQIAAESGTESQPYAVALQNMKKTYVPQITIFVVGDLSASLTMKNLFISTPEDTEGANCDYIDMGLIYGDDFYDDAPADEPPAEDNGSADTETDETTTTTTKATQKDTDEAAGAPTGLIIGIIAAVVVIAAVAVVIIIKKKKA